MGPSWIISISKKSFFQASQSTQSQNIYRFIDFKNQLQHKSRLNLKEYSKVEKAVHFISLNGYRWVLFASWLLSNHKNNQQEERHQKIMSALEIL